MSRYVRPSGDAPEYTDALKAQVERLTAELAHMQTMQKVDQRVFEKLRETQDLAEHWAILAEQRRVELGELKAQSGEPYGIVYEYHDYFGKHLSFRYYQRNGNYPAKSVKVYTHPTELPYNPLNDYAVISMNPTEPVKAQAGEPDFYVRRRPSPGYEVVSSSDPMAQPAYLHPTTERRVIPEELITRIKQTANRWANRSYDCGNRDGMGYQSSTPAKLMDQSRDDFNELIEELRNALNAAPKEMK